MAQYKIKDIEQLTGIKAHTIRIWEKRYGILVPQRSETSIRTYSDEELVTLINIALLNKHGIKISKIAQLSTTQIAAELIKIKTDPNIDDSQEKLILSLIQMNEGLFLTTTQELINQKGLENTFVSYIIPFLERLGIMWLVGSINPAQEHFISNLIRQKLISAIDQLPVINNDEAPIVLFMPEHEMHELSLLFYHYVLRKAGRNSIYLGQSLPYKAIVDAVNLLKPGCLLTSWLTSVDKKFITNYFKNLWEETKIDIYGGGWQLKSYAEHLINWTIIVGDADSIRSIETGKGRILAQNLRLS
jgi:MerR family transcriptional regulator, light-induced transcriptional regulator